MNLSSFTKVWQHSVARYKVYFKGKEITLKILGSFNINLEDISEVSASTKKVYEYKEASKSCKKCKGIMYSAKGQTKCSFSKSQYCPCCKIELNEVAKRKANAKRKL